jgi:DNA-damage-inducible protein J
MSKTTTIRARIEPSLKAEVESILSHLGLTASETIHLLYRQIKLRRGLPFAIEIPNALTAKTLRESRAGRGVKGFATKKELYADLGAWGASAAVRSSRKTSGEWSGAGKTCGS